MPESNHSPEQCQQSEEMNQPGEMNLNDLIHEGMMSEETKNFELDMNFIEMDEMDFDLSKKDQQSPNDIEFTEQVEQMDKEVIMDKQNENLIEKESQVEAEKQSMLEEQQQNHSTDQNIQETQSALQQTQEDHLDSNSVLIESSSSKSTIQKCQIIKLMNDHFYNNKLQDDLKIKQENLYLQTQKPEKLQFHLSDQKYEYPKLMEDCQGTEIKQNFLKTTKGLFEKKESFYGSQSADTDPSLKIDELKNQKLGDSHQKVKNLLKEFKNQSFEVRDRYFERQSQIYKKYILNMRKTLRKQYERCRLHDNGRMEQNLDRSKVQQRNKCQVEKNKKWNSLFNNQNNISELKKISQSPQHFLKHVDNQQIQNALEQQLDEIGNGQITNSLGYRRYLKTILLQMSQQIDISQKIQCLLQMEHRQLMEVYSNVVGAERVIKYETEVFEKEIGEGENWQMGLGQQQQVNCCEILQDQQQSHNSNKYKQTINSQQQRGINAQRNTHQQPIPQSINREKHFGQKQILRGSSKRMSLEQGQMSSIGVELMEIDDDECTPMFGLEVVCGNSNGVEIHGENRINNENKTINESNDNNNTNNDNDQNNNNNSNNDNNNRNNDSHGQQRITAISITNSIINNENAIIQQNPSTTNNVIEQEVIIRNLSIEENPQEQQLEYEHNNKIQDKLIVEETIVTNQTPTSSTSVSVELRQQKQKSIEEMSAEELRQFIKKTLSTAAVSRDPAIISLAIAKQNSTQTQLVQFNQQPYQQQLLQQSQQPLAITTPSQHDQPMMIELEQPSASQQHLLDKAISQQMNYDTNTSPTECNQQQQQHQQTINQQIEEEKPRVQIQQPSPQQHTNLNNALDKNNIQNNYFNAIFSTHSRQVNNNSNNEIIQIISQDSEQSIQVPRKPSFNLQINTTSINEPQIETTPTIHSPTTTTKQTVSANDVRSLLLQSYPNIEQIIGAASDQEILALYYELTGREDESQQQGNNNTIGLSNLQQEHKKQDRHIQQSNNAQKSNIETVDNNNNIKQFSNGTQIQQQISQNQDNPIVQQPITQQQQQQQQQYKQNLTPEELDLVIQNLIQSNSQIKDQISKLSREDLLALYREGIKQIATRRQNQISANNQNGLTNYNITNVNNTTRQKSSSRRNKKNNVAEIIDLQDDQQPGNANNNSTINNSGTNNTNTHTHTNDNNIHSNYNQQAQYHSTIEHQQQQQQPCIGQQPQRSTFSYLDQYNKAIAFKNKKTTNTTSITYQVNKTYLYALLQAHDYQNKLETILKPRQSIKYRQQTQKQISTLYLKHLQTHHSLKSTGLQIKKSTSKSAQKGTQKKVFILTKKDIKQNKSSTFNHIDEKFRKHINEGKYLTAKRTVISEEKKKKILELRNKRIQAERIQLQVLKTNESNKSSWKDYEPGEIPSLSTVPYLTMLLNKPQQPQRRYYLLVEQTLDPREMNRLEEEIGLQYGKKRVKRTKIEKNEKEIARIIKELAKNVDDEMGIELE